MSEIVISSLVGVEHAFLDWDFSGVFLLAVSGALALTVLDAVMLPGLGLVTVLLGYLDTRRVDGKLLFLIDYTNTS